MPRLPKEMTVAQLERALENKRLRLSELTTKREKLQKQLAKTESEIASLAGRGVAEGTGVRRRRRRPKNAKSLRAYVLEILGRSKKGLTIAELDDRVQATGYKSKSRNFRNVLYQCLYNSEEIGQDKETGRYVLKS